MQSILSRSIPLKDVITDLAGEMNVPVQQNCSEYQLDIPEKLGKGHIKGIDFQNGIGILLYDCTFREDMEIRFLINKVHPLKFLFCETGQLSHRFEDETDPHLMDILENIIVASSETNGHILHFQGGVETKVNSLEITRAVFLSHIECELSTLENELENLFRDVDALDMFYHHGNYSIKMADLFIEIDGFPANDFLRKIFMEGSAFKILTLQILQYQDDTSDTKHDSILRESEMKSVRDAAKLINNEILDFITVPLLAQKVGLNSNKLQDGFKELYHTTVNGYVHDRRLDLANSLLRKSDYSISEIVYLVGLSSKSYFSKIFKEKYGISPSTSRNNGNQRNGNHNNGDENHRSG